jgi:hypothetical protein
MESIGKRVLVLVVAAGAALSACSNSSGTGSTAPSSIDSATSTSRPGRARITSFVVPKSVQCGSAPNTTVRVSYAVRRALRHQLLIDGRVEPRATARRATVYPRVHCGGVPHSVALVAIDAAGRRTSQVRYLTTVLPKH